MSIDHGGPVMVRHFTIYAISLLLSACGVSTSSTSSFKVRMHGIYSPPIGASGDSAPKSQTYLFNAVKLTKSDGSEVSLYDGDPKTLKIIDRGQLVFSKTDMTDYDGDSFTSVLVQFDPTIVVTSKSGTSTTIALSSGDLQIDETFSIEKQKEKVLTIKIAWGDTITVNSDGSETVSPPSFSLKYEE
jgi:hypothetical protein